MPLLLAAVAPAQGWALRRLVVDTTTLSASGGRGGGPVAYRAPAMWEWDGTDWALASSLPVAHFPVGFADIAVRGEQVAVLTPDNITAVTWVRGASGWTARGPAPMALSTMMCEHPGLGGVVAIGSPDQFWNGISWTPMAAVPNRDRLAVIASDPSRGRIVALGIDNNLLIAVWEMDATGAWQHVPVPFAPSALLLGYFGWDPMTARMLLFVPTSGPIGTVGTWSWDGAVWTQLAPSTTPDGSTFALLARDPVRDRLRLFGYDTRDWEWSGSDWIERPGAPPRTSHRQVWNSLQQRLWRYDSRARHEWNGHDWTPTPMPPPPIGFEPMAFDLSSFGALLVRQPQSAPTMETWLQVQANAWQRVTTPVAPPARTQHALLAAVTSGGVVLFGGIDPGSSPLADTWLWNGAWTEVTAGLTVAPPAGAAVSGNPMQPGAAPMLASGSSIWRWAGAWQQVATGSPVLSPNAMVVRADGTPVVAGIDAVSTLVAEFRGGQWQSVRARSDFVDALLEDPLRGSVIAFDLGEEAVFTATPAAATAFGSGCGVPAPQLFGRGRPQIDEPSFAIVLRTLPNVPAGLALAPLAGNQPLGGGCTLWLSSIAEFRFALADASGAATFALPIPGSPALRGLTVFAQGGALQPAGTFAGMALSAALRLDVGD